MFVSHCFHFNYDWILFYICYQKEFPEIIYREYLGKAATVVRDMCADDMAKEAFNEKVYTSNNI